MFSLCVSGAGVATNISVVETKDKHGAKSSSKMAFLKLHGDRFLFFKTYVKIGTPTMGHCFFLSFRGHAPGKTFEI